MRSSLPASAPSGARLFAISTLALAAACGGAKAPQAPPSPPLVVSPTEPAAAAPPRAPVVDKRVVVSLGRSSGTSVVTRNPDGTVQSVLHVVENGRGPHTDATYRLAPDGTLAELRAKGHHTFGAKFEASFTVANGQATWESPEERGSATPGGPALYYPVAELPEIDGILVRAALAHGGSLRILPSGSARVEKIAETAVVANDQRRELIGYAIFGLSLAPKITWVGNDGEWFGTVSDWFSTVPEGWESAIEPLLAMQRDFDKARRGALAQKLAQRFGPAGVALTHVRVLDVERGRYLDDHTIVIVGDRITAVGPSRTTKVPSGAAVLELRGKTVAPGFFDMHVHLDDADGLLHLASGVTTVRDVGNQPDRLDELWRAFDDGSAIGPRLIRYGFIEGRNPKAASSVITAETADEARAGVEFYAKRGYDGIKIYNSMRAELVPLIAAEAHRRGMRVSGHVPVHMFAREVVAAGYDGIEHVNMLFLNFLAARETDTRDTTRFTLVGDGAPDLDLASAPVREFLRMLRDKRTVITPTVNAFEDLLVWQQGKVAAGLEDLVARLPVLVQRDYVMGGLPVDEAKHARYLLAFDKLLQMIKALVDTGVPVALGTDALAGLAYHHEMDLFARAGLPPAKILRMATIEAARLSGKLDRGVIAKGKLADLVVIDGDPLARIAEARRTELVLRGGVAYSCEALYEAVGVRRW